MRIVSLLPAATEFLYAIGLEPVGVSHECDHPPAARDLPTVTRTHVDADRTTAIDGQVESAMADDGSVFEIDTGRLAALDPDLIITQGTCAVCAVDAAVVHDAVAGIGRNPEVLTVDPHTIDDVLAMGRRIGRAAGVPQQADRLTEDLAERLTALDRRVEPTDRPTVAILDWLSPLMVAGHWVPEVVEVAGGRYPLVDPGSASRTRNWTTIRELDPDVLVAAPCGLDVESTRADADLLTSRPGWNALSAVESGEVYAMDGNAFLNRPGPRVVDAAELLAGVLHPDTMPSPPRSALQSLVDPGSRPAQ